MKTTAHRIAFYTRKAAAYGSYFPKPRPRAMKYRYERLLRYKEGLHIRIAAEKARPIW
jgi:hypothetical protein